MKKKNLKKLLLAVCCAALLVCVSIGATVAYLTSAEKVVNTFTVGKVAITLDEAKVDTNGTPVEDAARVKTNEYKLLPGHTYTKDPTVHVATDSEACYVFVKVANGISAIETTDSAKKITAQITAKGWNTLANENGVYYKEWKPSDATNNLVVFDEFTISGDKTATELEALKNAKIEITAYAIQKDGFTTAADAWAQVKDVTVAEPANP